MTALTISRAAEAVGFAPTTLRYYEDEGLLGDVPRSAAGYRLYDDRTLARARFIAHAKSLGLPLTDIRDLAALWAGDHCASVQHRLRELVRQRLADVAAQQSDLAAFADALAVAERRLASTPVDGACDESCACVTTAPSPAFSREAVTSLPVACALSGTAVSDRVQEWRDAVSDAVAREPMVNGVRLRFDASPAAAAKLARLAALEQDCCSFFAFTLSLAAGQITLEITAPGEAAALVDELVPASQG